MQLSPKNKRLIRIGIIFCIFVILLGAPLLWFVYNNHVDNPKASKKIVAYIAAILLSCIANLFTIVFITPQLSRWFKGKIIPQYLPSYFIVITLAAIIWNYILLGWIQSNSYFAFVPVVIALNTIVLLTMELTASRFDEAQARLENERLSMLSLEAKHEKLKSQLHPHFLFNSLNTLKVLIKKQPEIADSYLVKLSSFLRFSITHNEQNIVSLKDELEVSLYYLEMQKIRFGNALSYRIDIPETVLYNARVPVFSLQVLLENAVKHNSLTELEPLKISIEYVAPDYIVVENNLTPKPGVETGLGIGLKNLSERYLLLLHYVLIVEKDDSYFRVRLKLANEHSLN